jgi:hypothetical protein
MSKLLSSLSIKNVGCVWFKPYIVHPRKKIGQSKIFRKVSPAHELVNDSKKNKTSGQRGIDTTNHPNHVPRNNRG